MANMQEDQTEIAFLLDHFEAAAKLFKRLYIGKCELELKKMQLYQPVFVQPAAVAKEDWNWRKDQMKSFNYLPLPFTFVNENFRRVVESVRRQKWELTNMFYEMMDLNFTFRAISQARKMLYTRLYANSFMKKCEGEWFFDIQRRLVEDTTGIAAISATVAKRMLYQPFGCDPITDSDETDDESNQNKDAEDDKDENQVRCDTCDPLPPTSVIPEADDVGVDEIDESKQAEKMEVVEDGDDQMVLPSNAKSENTVGVMIEETNEASGEKIAEVDNDAEVENSTNTETKNHPDGTEIMSETADDQLAQMVKPIEEEEEEVEKQDVTTLIEPMPLHENTSNECVTSQKPLSISIEDPREKFEVNSAMEVCPDRDVSQVGKPFMVAIAEEEEETEEQQHYGMKSSAETAVNEKLEDNNNNNTEQVNLIDLMKSLKPEYVSRVKIVVDPDGTLRYVPDPVRKSKQSRRNR